MARDLCMWAGPHPTAWKVDGNHVRPLQGRPAVRSSVFAATVFFGYETTYLFYNNRVTGVTMYPMDYYWLTKDVKLAA